jgi:hypothetical protein
MNVYGPLRIFWDLTYLLGEAVSSLEGENRERSIDAVPDLDRRGQPARAICQAPPQTQDAALEDSGRAEAGVLQHVLLAAQNSDGGWGYHNANSWTEPTALAALALDAHGCNGLSYHRGCAWLAARQREDGGWPPNTTVRISTWVTSLAFLALSEQSNQFRQRAAIQWLKNAVNQNLPPFEQFIFGVLHLSSPKIPGASPWFPGTAGWVIPTSLNILSLSRAARILNDPDLASIIAESRSYLLAHCCRDGGWNHGGSSYRSENAQSYPETTGLALLALRGVPYAKVAPALHVAESFLDRAESAEGLAWLQMGLAKQGKPPGQKSATFPCRTIRDISLRLLALAANSPRNQLMAA